MWMKHCLENHNACGIRDLGNICPEASSIVLIDVRKMCLIKSTTAAHYLSLSYVWGSGTRQYMTLLDEYQNLLEEGSLRRTHVWTKISRVIQDAIEVTNAVGAPYLWCDTLCIIQDDPRTKPTQLALMAEIYNRSMATLINIRGQHANTALLEEPIPPTSRPRKPYDTEPILKAIRESTYSKRGSCYQEQLLAKRRIYFMENEVIFHCREDMFTSSSDTASIEFHWEAQAEYKTYHPSVLDEVDDLHTRGHGSEWPDNTEDDQHEFLKKIVEEFSAKQLTVQSDVLDACCGIFTAFGAQAKWSFIAGTPTALLPSSLLWVPTAGQTAELDISSSFKRRTYGNSATRLPSWSWMG